VVAENFQRHAFGRNKRIVLETIDLTGELEITEPTVFYERMLTGIGPAKAFGCGMLVLIGVSTGRYGGTDGFDT
jgi:CRISPR system Cascade subunit CasE